MPKSIFDRIGVGEIKPTRITLQLADQSVKHPLGIVEDLPIQIGKYFVPIDFVVVEMEEDDQTPLLLGRPFLNTARAVIEVHEGKISFKIGDETITFQIARSMQYPQDYDSICKIDQIDDIVEEVIMENLAIESESQSDDSEQTEDSFPHKSSIWSDLHNRVNPTRTWSKHSMNILPSYTTPCLDSQL